MALDQSNRIILSARQKIDIDEAQTNFYLIEIIAFLQAYELFTEAIGFLKKILIL